ncbi:biotin-dependent carboxyltransferase family protein [Vitreoscilla massiliensis]|uniref:Biotin-dependent carboxyltransferase family protein n=1 Tax=Vitreoscilla massiliensis TaxID=1689272 RepID=A0ABY4E4E4_9NEIS|nr:biotin-dependent carboxyltransferase family protein [Vitreoscilla massiliensis]UOO89730.1 biotin-dependent carboxyltransferase family protein [Vitreoscilla massiliensis]
MKRTVKIIKPGLAISIQDQGRQGYYHLGIPPSGAMDQYSFVAANLLVGNPKHAAVLECTLMAPELEFSADTVIAITGAQLVAKVNGEEIPTNATCRVPAGGVLTLGFMTLGARAYIAFDGGIDVPEVLGSRSFYGLGSLGGLNGKKLEAGDVLPLGHAHAKVHECVLPEHLRAPLNKHQEIRVIKGLYDHRLSDTGRDSFYADEWKVASEADRIGYRCKGGQALTFIDREPPFGAGSDPSNIVDAPYPIGSIQVPAGVEPIILHRDAVSGGGYAMVATVISADMDVIGQLQPNYVMKFKAVSMDEALLARAQYQQRLQQLEDFFTQA